MKVLVIPEDQSLDSYILRPIIERLFAESEVKARVDILPEPRLRGGADALDGELIAEIVESNRATTDLFLLIVDRDCDRANHAALLTSRVEEHSDVLIGCLAMEEVEVWMLALHRANVEQRWGVRWNEIRADCDPKERFAEPLLQSLESSGPGRGRKAAMRALGGQWKTLCSLCPEITELQKRVLVWAGKRA